jgi:hypothetical protein
MCALIHCSMMNQQTVRSFVVLYNKLVFQLSLQVLSIVADPEAFNEVLVVLAEHLIAARQAAKEPAMFEPFPTETDRKAYMVRSYVNSAPVIQYAVSACMMCVSSLLVNCRQHL